MSTWAIYLFEMVQKMMQIGLAIFTPEIDKRHLKASTILDCDLCFLLIKSQIFIIITECVWPNSIHCFAAAKCDGNEIFQQFSKTKSYSSAQTNTACVCVCIYNMFIIQHLSINNCLQWR